MKKHLLINGWHIIADCKLNKFDGSIVQVVIKYKSTGIFHLTFHEQNQKKHKETHVVVGKDKKNQTYHLIDNWKENWASMHWLYLPTMIGKYNKQRDYDFVYNSDYNHIAYTFWITPLNTIINDGRHIYQHLNPNEKVHEHKQPRQSFHTIAITERNELSIELLETCCFAIKRDKYDLTKRSIGAVCNEFFTINKNTGKLEIQRFVDRSIFPKLN